MRILITGAAGQLGTDLVRHCTEAGDEVIACSSAQLDLSQRDSVAQAITGTRPDVVVNAGAWTAVDACEADPDRAWRVNALGVRWVTDAARTAGSHVIQVSTDYVFDGTKPEPTTSGIPPVRVRPTGVRNSGASGRWIPAMPWSARPGCAAPMEITW